MKASCPDAYYWYNRCQFLDREFISVFTVWLGYLWKTVTGGNLLAYWSLAWIITLVSFSVPYFLLQKKSNYLSNIPYLAIGLLFFGRCTYQLYDPIATTMLFSVCIGTLLLKTNFSSIKSVAVLGVLSAFLVASRFPNILILPLSIVYLCIMAWANRENIYMLIRKVVTYISVFFPLYYLLVASITGHFNLISFAISEIHDIPYYYGESHTIMFLISRYFQGGVQGIIAISGIVGALFIAYYVDKNIQCFKIALRWGMAVLFLSVMIYLYHGVEWFPVYSFIIITLIVIKAIDKGTIPAYCTYLFLILIGVICCAGSDCALDKMYYYFAPMAPVVFIQYKDFVEKHLMVKVYSAIFLIVSVYALNISLKDYTVWSDFKNVPKLMTQSDYDIRKQMYSDFESVHNDGPALFYGFPHSHFMYASTGTKMLYKPTYWMEREYRMSESDINREISEIIDAAQKDGHAVIFDFCNHSLLEKKAIENGFTKEVVSDCTTIYYLK